MREAHREAEWALDAAGWPWSRRLSLWLDVLLILEETAGGALRPGGPDMQPVALGSWRCRSGNSVEVFVERDARGIGHAEFQWDTPPPLSPSDQADYDRVILPDVLRQMGEYLEQTGRALVIRA